MYVRPPNNTTERLKVPENYRGNAFGASGEYTDMPSPVRLPRAEYDLPPEEFREQSPIRTNNSATTRDTNSARSTSFAQHENNDLNSEKAIIAHTSPDSPDVPTATSALSALLHQTNSSAHFPFGHGIGTEELLILGVMLLVFTHGSESGEYDNTLILLLALLLFSG